MTYNPKLGQRTSEPLRSTFTQDIANQQRSVKYPPSFGKGSPTVAETQCIRTKRPNHRPETRSPSTCSWTSNPNPVPTWNTGIRASNRPQHDGQDLKLPPDSFASQQAT